MTTEPQYTLSNSRIPSFRFFNYSCCAFMYVSFSILLVSTDTDVCLPVTRDVG